MVRLKVPACTCQVGNVVFQFHYGTIKRKDKSCVLLLYVHFNSTMVRLKVADAAKEQSYAANFNSTMVRLKALPLLDYVTSGVFQFHYGTIKSRDIAKETNQANIFQFHYGTIKRSTIYVKVGTMVLYFNSTMVRLKEISLPGILLFIVFQFHYGTIKSHCPLMNAP